MIYGILGIFFGGGLGFLLGGGESSRDELHTERSVVEPRMVREKGKSHSEASLSGASYEEITSQPGQTARISALIELYSNLEIDQFAAEAEKLDDLPFSERILAAYLLFASWAEVAPLDAMEHAKTKMGFAGNFVKPTVIQSWAASDPISAAAYYEENQSEFSMMGMMGRRGGRGAQSSGAAIVAGEWAKRAPEAALAWAESLKGKDSDQATASVLKELARTDPSKAARMLTEVDEGNRSAAYQSIAAQWASTDWKATESWMAGLAKADRDLALSSAVTSLAKNDPVLAADKVLTIDDDRRRGQAMEQVAGELAKTDPVGAMDWVMKNGSEDLQKEAVGDVLRPWVAQDRQGAYEWVSSQPEGEVRDSAVTSYIFSDQSGPVEERITLAGTISDDRSRDRALGMAAFQWISEDQEAGTAFVENTDLLSERAKERVLRRANR